eukprot:403351070
MHRYPKDYDLKEIKLKQYVLIEYSKGPEYWDYATSIRNMLERHFPKIFNYELRRDPSVTERLEVTIYPHKSYQDPTYQVGTVVHSKENGQGLVKDDWDTFLMRVKLALEKCKENL